MESWYNSLLQSWPVRRLGLFTEEPTVETCEKKPGEQFTAVLAPWESYIVTLQSLLIWEKPIRSCVALLVFNMLYWFCVYCDAKPLFVTSSLGLLTFLHQQWVHTIWPEIRVPLKPGERPAHYTDEWLYLNPSVLSAPEVGLLLDQWCNSVQGWLDTCIQTRRQRPALFCLCSCCFFTLLLFTGQLMPGSMLLYLLASTLLLLPGAKLHLLPGLKARSSTVLHTCRRKYWDKLAIGTSNSGSRESSPDELSEFLPELGSAEAEAALAVPLTSEDPPEVVAAVAQRQAAAADRSSHGRAEPDLEPHLYSSPRTATLAQDSPYGSLAPHIPTHSQIPGVSDSSDEEEHEFMQGLVFDASTRRGPSLHSSYPPPSHHGGIDYLDSTVPASSAVMQNLASSFMQYTQAGGEGAGSLLSSLGQSMFTTVMNNINQSASNDYSHAGAGHPHASAGQPHASAGQPHYRDDLSDDFSEPEVPQRAPERRVRRRLRRPARAGQHQGHVIEPEDVPSNGDFEFISDDEMPE